MLVTVVGPTATGKSDLALSLAQSFAESLGVPGEVINADASQLYRGMDIGTAKLPPDQRRGVPHHMLDVLEIADEASVAAYQRDAFAAVDAIRHRGGLPLLTGGSGLYVRAVVDDLAFPGTDPQVRAFLEAELDQLGPAALHARLGELDPVAAAGILPSNGRRVVRALEVIEITGQRFSATMPDYGPRPGVVQIGLDQDAEVLDDRIGTRVTRMIEQGLVEEVEHLAALGLRETRTASRAIGYQQVLEYLAGRCTLEEASEATATATRRLVRRQRSWFRRDPRIVWLDAGAPDVGDQAQQAVRRALEI